MKQYLPILLLFLAITAQAQIMQNNNDRTKIEAQIESRPHSVGDDAADGQVYGHVYATHNFLFTPISKIGVEGRYEANNGGNAYFRFGLKGTHAFVLKNRKTIALNVNLFGEASQYAVENFDGHIVGLYMYSASREKRAGVGIVGLLHNPSGIPCVPIFMYYKRLSPKTDFDFATYLASLNYDITPSLRFSIGYSMSSQRFWLKDADGKRYMDNRALFTPQAVLQWNVAKPLSLGAYAGYDITVSHALYTAYGSDKIRKLDKKHTPFFALRGTLKL